MTTIVEIDADKIGGKTVVCVHADINNDPYSGHNFYVEFTDGTWLSINASGGAYCSSHADVELCEEVSHIEYLNPHTKQFEKRFRNGVETRRVYDVCKPWLKGDV